MPIATHTGRRTSGIYYMRFRVPKDLIWLYVKNRGKEFWGIHSGRVFSSLSAEHADTQAVVFKIPEAVRSSLDELHFPVEAFGNPVVLREAEHPGDFLLPRVQRAPKGTHSLEWALAKLVYAGQKPRYK